MIYDILSIIAICAEFAILLFFIYNAAVRKRAFSKKTPWFSLPVFILVYYLYMIGLVYQGKQIDMFVVLKTVLTSLETFVFKTDIATITPLAHDNAYYYAAMTIAILLAGATLAVSIGSLVEMRIRNAVRLKKSIKACKEFVLGDSPSALSYAKANNAIVLIRNDAGTVKKLLSDGYCVKSYSGDGYVAELVKKFKSGKTYHFIAFADGISSYEQTISRFFKDFGRETNNYFTLHIEASLEEMDIINRKFIDVATAGNICVKSFNRYELVARKFVIDHPMSLYIPQSFYGESRTVKEDKNINVVCLGFGKVNYELMKLMIVQNQFVGLSKDGKKFIPHPVNYYVYDSQESKIYSELFIKIKSEYSGVKGSGFPPTDAVCNLEEVQKTNIYSVEFVEKLQKLFADKDSFTYVLVSIGSDFENIEYAEQLNAVRSPENNVKIFVRIRNNKTLSSDCGDLISFGYDDDIERSDVIVGEKLDTLARRVNANYSYGPEQIDEFNRRPTIERDSNLYHAMSVFFKVGLLGFRFVGKDESGQEVSREQFDESLKKERGVGDYSEYFKISPYTMLAFSEHLRWEALYILKGFTPMPVAEITVTGTGADTKVITKNVEKRRHCCLTDYYGLDKYHRYILKLYNDNGAEKTIYDVETYKYDCMFIDGCYDEMSNNGFKLVSI